MQYVCMHYQDFVIELMPASRLKALFEFSNPLPQPRRHREILERFRDDLFLIEQTEDTVSHAFASFKTI